MIYIYMIHMYINNYKYIFIHICVYTHVFIEASCVWIFVWASHLLLLPIKPDMGYGSFTLEVPDPPTVFFCLGKHGETRHFLSDNLL